MSNDTVLKIIVGKTIKDIRGLEKGSSEVIIEFNDGSDVRFYHEQCCCEDVHLNDFIGDINRLRNSEIVSAREDSNNNLDKNNKPLETDDESYTWTFYNIQTTKENLWMSFYGTSNGYYSERVDMVFNFNR